MRLFLDAGAVFRHGVFAQVEDVGDFLRAEREHGKHTNVEFGLVQVGMGSLQFRQSIGIGLAEHFEDAVEGFVALVVVDSLHLHPQGLAGLSLQGTVRGLQVALDGFVRLGHLLAIDAMVDDKGGGR